MKKIQFVAFIALSLFLTTSCNKEEIVVEEDQRLNRNIKIEPSGFCEDAQTSNYVNGHQSRSFVEVGWDFFLDSNGPPPPPGLIDFHVQFQAGYYQGGFPVYGTVYNFTHTYISTVTQITEQYSSLGDLDGNVQGRWRVRVEDCAWSPWKDYYFNP